MKDVRNKIKIIIADDHALFRTGIKTSLISRNDLQVVGEAENGLQLLNMLENVKPDVVLLDIQMPVLDGLSTLKEIKKIYPSIKVVIISFLNDPDVVMRMIELGANSYITKESHADIIYDTIVGVYSNGFHSSEMVLKSQKLIKPNYLSKIPTNECKIKVTDKEKMVLHFLNIGKSLFEIAAEIDLSVRTIEAMIDKLRTKTNTKSTDELLSFVIRHEIIYDGISDKFSELEIGEFAKLFKISTSIFSYINHDLSGQRSIAYSSLDQIRSILKSDDNLTKRSDEILLLLEKAILATESISSISAVIKSFVNLNRAKDLDDFYGLFISSPEEIVNEIRSRNAAININVKTATPRLRIIYPKVILHSIISELIVNSSKKKSENLEVIVMWSQEDNFFKCEVHDNGPGFNPSMNFSNLPFGMLPVVSDGMGLRIIERTIIDSGGHLFFSRSKLLNGARIYFDFPVLGSNINSVL